MPRRAFESAPLPQDREIHVWRVFLDDVGLPLARWEATLSASERRRAEQFRFDHDRRRFVVRRGVLRALLGRYLGMSADDVTLAIRPLGKPALVPADGSEDLRFNYSHSGGLAVYAFTVRADVGVDTERIRSLPDLDAIVRSMFTEAERLSLGREENRLEQFFHLWTAKEAVLKASGEGLMRPPASIEITLGTTPRIGLARDLAGADGGGEWSVSTLTIADGFAGAVAVARGRRPHVVTVFDWGTSAFSS